MSEQGVPVNRKWHLYHLIFNDAMVMEMNGCNHNAGDRAACYDQWLEDVQSGSDFLRRATASKDRYDGFHEGKQHKKFLDVTGYEVIEDKVMKDIEQYAFDMTERAYDWLEGKVGR